MRNRRDASARLSTWAPTALALALLWRPAAARAQAEPPRDLSFRHHGFFAHLGAGAGVRFLFAEDPATLGGSQRLVAADSGATLALGWTVADNLIVQGQLRAGVAAGLRGIGGDLGPSDVSLGYLSAGLGLTAYGVTDVFFSPMLGYIHAGWLDRGGGVPLPASLDGITTGVQLGKEWWIGRHFLAGLGGQLDYQWLRGGGDTWHGLGASVLGSLALN